MSTAVENKSAREFLSDLRDEIVKHPGVAHSLLGRMGTDARTKEHFRILAGQHFPLVSNFCSYMELLLLRAPNSEAKCWIAKVLVDEYGERSDGDDHAVIYTRFMNACGYKNDELEHQQLHPEVVGFIKEHLRICTEEPFLVGLGAVGPGHEWAIPTMFEHITLGLRRAGFSDQEIEYWSCHLEQDQDHGAWLEEALVDYCDTEEHREQVRRGAILSLNAREKFWWGVADKINAKLTGDAIPGFETTTAKSEGKQPTYAELKGQLKPHVVFGGE